MHVGCGNTKEKLQTQTGWSESKLSLKTMCKSQGKVEGIARQEDNMRKDMEVRKSMVFWEQYAA